MLNFIEFASILSVLFPLLCAVNIQYMLEIVGTAFFAVSGALVASNRTKPDWFGVTFISFITATGGGSLRDILLGSYPLTWIGDVNFIYAVLAGIVFARLFYNHIKHWRKIFFIFDSLAIAMFTVLGTEKALTFEIAPLVAAILGMFSAVMGGILRDVLSNDEPILFKKEIYATACLVGALLYLGLDLMGIDRDVRYIISVICIFIIRFVVVKYQLALPRFVEG